LSAPEAELNAPATAALLLARWWARPLAEQIAEWPSSSEAAGLFSSPVPCAEIGDAPALLTEYERLFVGPGPVPCPPYESYWRVDVPAYLRHSLMGPCIAGLLELYGRLGIAVDPSEGELPDHIAVELEALGFALSLPDDEGVANQLVTAHLSVWVSQFCASVTQAAKLAFYRDLAVMTGQWLTTLA